ncbi:MAG: ABC transporter ATP-binding protein [Gammaproteobacteria bacterium]
MTTLSAEQLSVSIGPVQVCSALDLDIHSGERWCILGRNGAGKTTLLHTLCGLHPADKGQILLNGQSLDSQPRKALARGIGILLQDHDNAFPATVLESALIGRHPWLGALQWESDDDRARARGALQETGLAGMEIRMTDTLSGGEQRRLDLATLLTQNPEVYLLDEPTNHLDLHHQVRILELLRKLAEEYERALCMALHDINMAVRYCNRFLLLFGAGETAQGNSETVLTPGNLERLYRHELRFIDTPDGPVWLPK